MKTREELLKSGHSLDANSMIYGERLVKAILAAPTQEQMKCEFCNPHINFLPPEGTGLISSENKDIGLKYCPHCGRKLGDE